MPEHVDEQELDAVAMFPLPNAVLLPGGLLPLHIFEPRYRDMTSDILAGSKLLAMARLQPGYEPFYHGRPAVHPVVGVGRVIASDQLDDGRYNILVRGLIRAELDEELPPTRSYRLVRARLMPDEESTVPTVLSAMHHKLVALCDQLSMALEQGGEQLRQIVRSEPLPGACADVVCAALVTDLDERQSLLENVDPAARIERAIHHVSRLLVELGPHSDLLC